MDNVDGCQQLPQFLQVVSSTQIVNHFQEPLMNNASYGVRNVFQMVNFALKNRLVLHFQPKILVYLALMVDVFGNLQLKTQMHFAEFKSVQTLLQILLHIQDVLHIKLQLLALPQELNVSL